MLASHQQAQKRLIGLLHKVCNRVCTPHIAMVHIPLRQRTIAQVPLVVVQAVVARHLESVRDVVLQATVKHVMVLVEYTTGAQ